MKTTAKTKRTAYVEVRSQSAKGAWPASGPDTYVAVQIVPAGVERLKVLNLTAASRRGIGIVPCGEGYSNRQQTTRSSLRQAMSRARELANKINQEGER